MELFKIKMNLVLLSLFIQKIESQCYQDGMLVSVF